jgi:UDP-N-acetyl-D-glucosamine 4,6-dehydratase
LNLKYLISLPRIYKKIILFFIDLLILISGLQLSFNLRFETFYILNISQFYFSAIFIALFFLLQFIDKVYSLPSRNFNISIISTIIKNTFISTLITFIINIFYYKFFETPRSIIIISFFLVSLLLIFKHSLLLNFFYIFKRISNRSKNNVIIYGSENKCYSIINELKKNTKYNFLGCVDNDRNKHKNYEKFFLLQNISLNNFLKTNKISHLLVSKKLNTFKRVELLKDICSLNIRVIFLEDNLDDENIFNNLAKFRPDYNDILDRKKEDHLEDINLKQNFNNKNILIIGAGGSIGSELSSKIFNLNFRKLILVDLSEISLHNLKNKLVNLSNFKKNKIEFKLLNCSDLNLLEKIFIDNKIDYVFHAAAYKHVSFLEENISYGVKNNILLTKNICFLSSKYKVKNNILISTDKAVNPSSVMGLSKRICENIFKIYSKKNKKLNFIITRFGNVIGSSGSVLPIFKNCIENNLTLTVTHKKASRYVMTIDEACSLVIKASVVGQSGNFYVFDMGEPINILDLAKKFINMYGLRYKLVKKINNQKNKDFIEIYISGLGRGEKMHEELSYNKDLIPTKFKKLLISKETFIDLDKDLEKKIINLENIINKKSQDKVIRYLKTMI